MQKEPRTVVKTITMTQKLKDLLDRAADINGRSLSNFILYAAEKEAIRTCPPMSNEEGRKQFLAKLKERGITGEEAKEYADDYFRIFGGYK